MENLMNKNKSKEQNKNEQNPVNLSSEEVAQSLFNEILESVGEFDEDFFDIEDTPELKERRNKTVDALIEQDKKNKGRDKIGASIYNKYAEYIKTGKASVYSELYPLMNQYYFSEIVKILKNGECFTIQDAEDLFQECIVVIWKLIEEDRRAKNVRVNFLPSCMLIFKFKSISFIRKRGIGGRKKQQEEATEENKQTVAKKSSFRPNPNHAVSLDETVSDDKGNPKPKHEIPTIDQNIPERMESKLLHRRLLLMYIKTLTELKLYPPSMLALFYADILPHMQMTLKDYKQSSSIQAFKLMRDKTLWQLAAEAEDKMKRCFDPNLKWCSSFTKELSEPCKKLETDRKLGDIVYTEAFTMKQTDHWASYTHRTIVNKMRDAIVSDSDLFELTCQYIFGNGKGLSGLITDGGNTR